jgi:hypothetical protein
MRESACGRRVGQFRRISRPLAAFASRPISRYVAGRTIRARFPGRFNVEHRSPVGRYDPFVKARLWVTIKLKYVNMADINFSSLPDRPATGEAGQKPQPAEPIWDIIELLFFAYRDFVSDPDDVLARFNFGHTTGCCTSSIAIPG